MDIMPHRCKFYRPVVVLGKLSPVFQGVKKLKFFNEAYGFFSPRSIPRWVKEDQDLILLITVNYEHTAVGRLLAGISTPTWQPQWPGRCNRSGRVIVTPGCGRSTPVDTLQIDLIHSASARTVEKEFVLLWCALQYVT